MWNWLVSGLAANAKIILYDGSPTYPDTDSLWDLVARERVTVFGTSPKFLVTCEKSKINLKHDRDLSNLRTILSTGSPLSPQSFDYVANEFSGEVQLSSISGGTDIISCFALGNPMLPVRRGEMQCFGLGLAVDVFDSGGQSIFKSPENWFCTKPFPSQPARFLE